MRRLLFAILFAGVATVAYAGSGCTGADDCKACKTCKSCKYCHKEGGTCGVLKQRQGDSTPEEPPKKPDSPKPRQTSPRKAPKPFKYQPWKPFRPIKPKVYKAPQLRRHKDGTYYWTGMPKPKPLRKTHSF